MSSTRQATLTLSGPEDKTVVLVADFDQLTLTRRQENGYRRDPDGATPFSPAAAAGFWAQLETLAAKGLRDGKCDMFDGICWKFEARDGKKSYSANGQILEQGYVGDTPPEDSYAELKDLFELLSR
jgi:hypothetical protein